MAKIVDKVNVLGFEGEIIQDERYVFVHFSKAGARYTCNKIEQLLSFNKMSLKDASESEHCIYYLKALFPEFDSVKELKKFIEYLNRNCIIYVH